MKRNLETRLRSRAPEGYIVYAGAELRRIRLKKVLVCKGEDRLNDVPMRMRILGFSWVPNRLPEKVPATAVFERIQQVAGQQYGDYIAAASPLGEWWAGFLLKIRDSRAMTTLKQQQGVLHFTAEKLADGTSIAEPNFFIAHQSNGHGLYCHHHISASLMGDFGYFCHHRFQEMRKSNFEAAAAAAHMTVAATKALRKQFRGNLVLEQILKAGSFDAHVKNLKKISKLEANLVSFELKEALFQPLAQYAKRKKVVLSFDPDGHSGLIANSITDCRQQGMFENATVHGEDAAGVEQRYKTSNDAAIFADHDYDTIISSLAIRFDDLDGSIKNSEIIKLLLKLGGHKDVRAALNI